MQHDFESSCESCMPSKSCKDVWQRPSFKPPFVGPMDRPMDRTLAGPAPGTQGVSGRGAGRGLGLRVAGLSPRGEQRGEAAGVAGAGFLLDGREVPRGRSVGRCCVAFFLEHMACFMTFLVVSAFCWRCNCSITCTPRATQCMIWQSGHKTWRLRWTVQATAGNQGPFKKQQNHKNGKSGSETGSFSTDLMFRCKRFELHGFE